MDVLQKSKQTAGDVRWRLIGAFAGAGLLPTVVVGLVALRYSQPNAHAPILMSCCLVAVFTTVVAWVLANQIMRPLESVVLDLTRKTLEVTRTARQICTELEASLVCSEGVQKKIQIRRADYRN